MAQSSLKREDDGLTALLKAKVTRRSTFLQPEELTDVSEHDDGDDLKRVSAQNASLQQNFAALEQQFAAFKQQLAAFEQQLAERGPAALELDQALPADQNALSECRSLREKIDLLQQNAVVALERPRSASQKKADNIDSILELRQLLNDFRQKGPGKVLDGLLFKQACQKFRQDFSKNKWFDRKNQAINTFSGVVIHLATEKRKLQNEDPNFEIEREIRALNRKLGRLRELAASCSYPEYRWKRQEGVAYYFWCLLVAHVNHTVHPEMSNKKSLCEMETKAAKREYEYDGVQLAPAVKAVIRLQKASLQA